VLSFLRRGREVQDTAQDLVLVVCNFTPVPRAHYRVGVPSAGYWQELLNSDAKEYGGSGMGNGGGAHTEAVPAHGYAQSLSLVLPPLGVLYLKPAWG
jgi:1,4-alpha-glucan branching enzyme